jgi:hypothetical protein
MLHADLFYKVEKNRFTGPEELGEQSRVRVIWWANPRSVGLHIGDLIMSLSPAQARDLARNLQEASAKAQAYPEALVNSSPQPEGQRRATTVKVRTHICVICYGYGKIVTATQICNELNKPVCDHHAFYCVEEGHGTRPLESNK